MSLLKIIAPAVALASGAFAAECSTSGTLTVTASADASNIASCQTYTGSIAIATDASELSLPPTRITGDLVAVPNGQLSSLSAPKLRQVDGMLSITQQQQLATLSMPNLIEADVFVLSAIGQNLLTLDFGSVGLTQVSNLTLDDTYLQNFDGINLMTADGVQVTSNILLTDLTMQIRNVTGSLIIRGNTHGLSVNLPNLAAAGDVLINDCSSVSLPSLFNVSNTVAFTENTFTSLNLPNITNVGPGSGGFNVDGNPMLSNLTLPLLNKVNGGVDVLANNKLTGTINLPNLELVGSGNFNGTYNNLLMPKLERMRGTLTLESSEDIDSVCSHFKGNNAIGGSVRCESAATSTSTSSSSTSTSSKSAAGHYAASPEAVFSIFGALAALFGLFM